MKLSVVVPIYSQQLGSYFWHILQQFIHCDDFELIIVDGVSHNQATLGQRLGNRVNYHNLPQSTRGQRLTFGIQQAKHEHVLLQHPRSLLSADGLHWLTEVSALPDWVTFTHRFDDEHPFLKWVSWYSNIIRVDRKQVVYLDHCMVVRRSLLQPLDLNHMAIFEDTLLSQLLQQQVKPMRLPFSVITSAIRFKHRGVYRHFLMNQGLKMAYTMGISNQQLNRWYERKLNLNQQN